MGGVGDTPGVWLEMGSEADRSRVPTLAGTVATGSVRMRPGELRREGFLEEASSS